MVTRKELRKSANKKRTQVGRRLVPVPDMGRGSVFLPKPSNWFLLSGGPETHVFGHTARMKVPDKRVCYEIGVSEPRKEPPKDWVVYVGVAGIGKGQRLRGRFYNHASRHGSNIKDDMDKYLRRGYWIWGRYYVAESAIEAEALEQKLLKVGWWHYLWNVQQVPPNIL